MGYRADNWKNPYPQFSRKEREADKTGGLRVLTGKHFGYENGADAMLDSLRAVHSLEGFERMTEVILKPE